MAYNKTKLLEAAQKFLQMGKTAQAIGEFQLILKHEPKDQVTLMTVGDLYVRQGETFQAIEYFERLAQLFLSDGFVAKAIAIYKKIAKLAPEETRPVERLADLYVQQGVLSEARPIYLRLADLHQRAGRHPQAAALLRKLLDAEPDNIRVQTRLAELAATMGQPSEAASAYRNAAEQLQRRGDHAEALKFVERALQADPGDAAAHLMKARLLVAAGQRGEAIALLNTLPAIYIGGEASEYLLDLYLQNEEFAAASEYTRKLLANNGRQYHSVLRVVNALLEARKPEEALPLLGLIRETLTDAGEHEALSESLQRLAEELPKRLEPLEWLVTLYERASDSFRLPDALSNLAAAYEAAGKNERARKVYEQLIERAPEDESVRQRYEKIQAKIADLGGAVDSEPEPEAPPAAEQQSTEILQEPGLDEPTQQFVTQSLTDVDLFSSYGLTQKAIDLLEIVLQRAPGHAAATERLLDLYLGAGNERRTAELALELEHIHASRNDTAAAERFAELHRRFERAASSVPVPVPAPVLAPDPVAAATQPAAPQFTVPASEPEPPSDVHEVSIVHGAEDEDISVHEVDLSEEWASMAGDLSGEAATDPPHAPEEMAAPPEESEATDQQQPPTSLPSLAEAMEELLRTEDSPPAETIAASETMAEPQKATSDADAGTAPPDAAAPGAPLSSDDFLLSLSSELDASQPVEKLHRLEATNGHSTEPTAPPEPGPATASSQPQGALHDVFDQFRAEFEDVSADDEDPETHYNLGIAYREMGLLEESISEFQKVAKTGNHGPAFRYAMQCCTLLGLAFMEKGEPSIAAMWYERALATPGLDQESLLALRYDLGVAQELAGEKTAARKSFSQVYGMNIDYRDVAERLAALGKGF